jgi:hypothetical protein
MLNDSTASPYPHCSASQFTHPWPVTLRRPRRTNALRLEAEKIMAMPRNLQRRPAKPALGNGRIQRAVRRAFYFDFELTSSDVYDWVYPRRRHLLTQAHRHSARRVLMTMADPIERVPPHGAWLWRLRNTAE